MVRSPERGSSALRAAADTMIKVTLDKGREQYLVDCDKQKDAEELSGLCFGSKVIEVGKDAEGEVVTSLALIHKEQAASMLAASGSQKAAAKAEKDAKMLSVLLAAPGYCVKNSNWGKASGLTDSTFRRHRDALWPRVSFRRRMTETGGSPPPVSPPPLRYRLPAAAVIPISVPPPPHPPLGVAAAATAMIAKTASPTSTGMTRRCSDDFRHFKWDTDTVFRTRPHSRPHARPQRQ